MVEVNWIAIIISVIITMIIGAIWYGPLFGKKWMGMLGYTKEKMESMKKNTNMPLNYGIQAVGSLVMAYVLSQILGFADAATVNDGFIIAFWVWAGFVAPVMLGKVLWEGKSWSLYALDVAYYLVILLAISAVLVMWV